MNRRHLFYSLPMILLLIVVVAGWFATDYLGNKARQEIIEESRSSVSILSISLSTTLSKNEEAVKSLAGSPWIVPALLSKGENDIEQANSALDRYGSAFDAISYLMDADGMTVASSNRKDPDSFVGKSYGFRPYFKEAARGQPGRYFGLGVTSGKRGFYASYPVQNHLGEVVGVVAMKKEIDDIAPYFRNYPYCFFISPDGVIFLSGTPAMVGKSLWPLDKAVRETLLASKQFGNNLSEAVIKKATTDGAEVALEGNDYHVTMKVIDSDGWSIVLLAPTDRIGTYRLIGILVTVLVGSLIMVFSGIIYVTSRSRGALQQSERKFRLLFNSMTAGFALHEIVRDADGKSVDYRFLQVNPAFEVLTGLIAEDIIGKTALEVMPDLEPSWIERYVKVATTGESIQFENYAQPLDRHYQVTAYSPQAEYFATVIEDVSERKQAETYREIGREVLQRLNEPGDLQDSVQRVLAALKTRTGFDAVGIRLQDGDDFPYFAQKGFSEDFLLTENTLVERSADGGICRNKDGSARLECTCGLVLSDKTDPANPLFTSGGSCWTNDSFPLLDLPSDQDPRLHPRNQCIHQGYASVALIPIRSKDRIVGLIQLNDRRKGRFTLDTVEILEGIASHIGAALMRKQAEEALRENQERYRVLIESQGEGVGIVDLNEVFQFANPAAHEIFGVQTGELAGRHLDEFVVPENWQATQDQIRERQDGLKSTYELNIVRPDGTHRCLLVTGTPQLDANGVVLGTFGVFRDMTDLKRAEEALRESRGVLLVVLNSIPVRVFWKDRNLKFLGCNTPFARDAGFEKPEDIIGKDDHAMGWRNQADLYRADDLNCLLSNIVIIKRYFQRQATYPMS